MDIWSYMEAIEIVEVAAGLAAMAGGKGFICILFPEVKLDGNQCKKAFFMIKYNVDCLSQSLAYLLLFH